MRSDLGARWGSAALLVVALVASAERTIAQDTPGALEVTASADPKPPVTMMFVWPVDRAAIATYRTAEECLAATQRVRDSVARARTFATGARTDTMAIVPAEAELASVIEVAERCGARFTLDNTPPASWSALYQLQFARNADARAETVLARQLAAQPDAARRSAVLTVALDITLGVHPVRVAAADSIVAWLDTLTGVSPLTRGMAHGAVAQYAFVALDTVRLRRHVAAIDRMLGELPSDARASDEVRQLLARMPAYRAIASASLLRDSGAVAFTRHLAVSQAHASGVTPDVAARAQAPVGERAAALDGAFWYRRAGTTPHPASGKPSLVVFDLRHDCMYDACAPSYAAMRRVGARFGDAIDVTLIAQTQGFFAERPPQTPEDEAVAIREYFLERLRLPGTLIVERTEFSVRPDPDGRRFNAATANQRAYRRRALDRYVFPPRALAAYVVAPDGTIVYATPPGSGVSPDTERGLIAVIDALLTQHPHP